MKTLFLRLTTASVAMAMLFLISCQDIPIDPWDPGDGGNGGGNGGGCDTTWNPGDDWPDDSTWIGDTVIDGDTVIIIRKG